MTFIEPEPDIAQLPLDQRPGNVTPEEWANAYQPWPSWIPAVSPAFRRRAHCQIIINGVDVTNRLDPYLISVVVTLKIGGAPGGQAVIELDDRDGKLPIPPVGLSAVTQVRLGWENSGPRVPLNQHINSMYDQLFPEMTAERAAAIANNTVKELPWQGGLKLVFQGYIQDVESGFNRRGGGRRLWITAHSANNYGLAKEPQSATMGSGDESNQVSVAQFLRERAKAAGLNFVTNGFFESLKRPFWHQDNESFQNLGQRTADEIGARFTIEGDTAYLMPVDLPGRTTIEGIWGINLIAWRIRPFAARPQWAGANSRFFNNYLGTWRQLFQNIPGNLPFGNAAAVAGLPNAAPNASVGGQQTEGMQQGSLERRGTGWAIINGEPSAVADSRLIILGARPGVDGRYRVSEAEHTYTRAGGYTTRLTLMRPYLGGGEDIWEKWGWTGRPTTNQNGVEVPVQTPPGEQGFERDPNERPGGVDDPAAGGGGGGGGDAGVGDGGGGGGGGGDGAPPNEVPPGGGGGGF